MRPKAGYYIFFLLVLCSYFLLHLGFFLLFFVCCLPVRVWLALRVVGGGWIDGSVCILSAAASRRKCRTVVSPDG